MCEIHKDRCIEIHLSIIINIYIYSRRRLKKFEVNLSFMSKGRDENFEIIKSRRLKMMVNN